MAILTLGTRVVRSVSPMVGIAALLVAGASIATGDLDVATTLQLVAIAVLVGVGRTGADLWATRSLVAGTVGMVVGLVAAGFVSVLELTQGREFVAWVFGEFRGSTPAIGRASGWWSHPNLWGSSVVVPAMLATVVALHERRPLVVSISVAVASSVVLASGSRAALAGLVSGLVTVGVVNLVARGGRRSPASILAVITVLVVVWVASLANPTWRERALGGLVGEVAPRASVNLFEASEDLTDPVWWRPFVDVDAVGASSEGAAVHRLSRLGGRWTDRVQQRVPLTPRVPYAFSFEFRIEGAGSDPVPAIVAWSATEPVATELVVRLPTTGEVAAVARGPAVVRFASAGRLGDGWRRLEAVFELASDSVVALEIGVAPRTVGPPEDPASSVEIRRVQLEQAPNPTPYVGTAPPDRTRLVASSAVSTRLALYRALVARIAERPWLGWGGEGYATVRALDPTDAALAPAHEHNLLLAYALRYGVVGVAAWVALMLGLGGRSPWSWAVVVAVVVMNAVDLSFVSDATYVVAAFGAGVLQRFGRGALGRHSAAAFGLGRGP